MAAVLFLTQEKNILSFDINNHGHKKKGRDKRNVLCKQYEKILAEMVYTMPSPDKMMSIPK
jgi:hypothetical protein